MTHAQRLSRRAVLKGMGAALALPALDLMSQSSALAGPVAGEASRRMAFLFVPNGANMADWTPATEGTDFTLPYILEPLAPFRDQLNVLTGLTHDKARANGDGPGDHARSCAAFLTGAQPYKTDGENIRLGISVDQLAAQHIGQQTRLPSLELGIDQGPQSGNCDSGYSCAYSANISWRSENTPTGKEINPRAVFERLFGGGDEREATAQRARRLARNQSILDFVREDAQSLSGRLGASDRRKLDEYLTSVREIERQIGFAEQQAPRPAPTFELPAGAPEDYAQHIRLMGDLMALAFQADLTRIASFMLANEGSNRSYAFIDVPEGHHDLSHHGRDPEKMRKIRDINRFHMEQFAYVIEKLQSLREGDGSVLDNSLVVYGCAIADGDAHNHENLPVVLLGRGGGNIPTGRHLRFADNTPMNNLYLTMLEQMGVSEDRFGDSTGRLESLLG